MQFALIAVIAALGGLLFGYDTGVISSALLFIRDDFHLSTSGQSLVAGIVLVGAVIGASIAGSLSDRFGRRLVILVTALIFVAGALLSAFAGSVGLLLVGRLLIGAAIGVASMLTPLYLAEIAPASSRGAVTSLNQLCITLGILVSYLVGYGFASRAGRLALDAGPGRGARCGAGGGDAGAAGKSALAGRPRPPAGGRGGAATTTRRAGRCRGRTDRVAHRPAARGWRGGRLVGAAGAAAASSADCRHRAGDVPADHRHQHGDLLRAADIPGGRAVVRLGLDPGDRRRWRGECAVDRGFDLADRPRRPAGAAAVEPGRHGGGAAGAGRRLCVRRIRTAGLDHRAVARRLRGVLRGRAGAGILVADRGDLSAGGARPSDEFGNDFELGIQFVGNDIVSRLD